MNNYEKIKAFSIDEMADWIINIQETLTEQIESSTDYYFYRKKEYRKLIKQWLESEAEE